MKFSLPLGVGYFFVEAIIKKAPKIVEALNVFTTESSLL